MINFEEIIISEIVEEIIQFDTYVSINYLFDGNLINIKISKHESYESSIFSKKEIPDFIKENFIKMKNISDKELRLKKLFY